MSQNIDWHFWKAMRTVKLWQGCALVTGLDPDALKPHPQAWMAGTGSGPLFNAKSFPNQDIKARFEKSLRLAETAVSFMTGPIFPQGQSHSESAGTMEVLLSDVVAFFVSGNWPEIPEALQSLSSQPIASATEPNAALEVPAKKAVLVAGVLTHSTKSRRQTLTPVIELAQKQCRNPKDTAEVWAALMALAMEEHSPLLGMKGKNISYAVGDENKELTRKALGQRLHRPGPLRTA